MTTNIKNTPIIARSTEELRDFTLKKLEKPGMTRQEITKKRKEIAEKLGISLQAVGHSVSPGERSNSARNGTRKRILKLLGYSVEMVFIAKIIRNK